MQQEVRLTVQHEHSGRTEHVVFFPTHGSTWRIYLDTNQDADGPARPVDWALVQGYRFSSVDEMTEFLTMRNWEITHTKGAANG